MSLHCRNVWPPTDSGMFLLNIQTDQASLMMQTQYLPVQLGNNDTQLTTNAICKNNVNHTERGVNIINFKVTVSPLKTLLQ